MPFGSDTFLFMEGGGAQFGVIQNISMPLGAREENVSQLTHDFINERSPRWSTVAKQCHLD